MLSRRLLTLALGVDAAAMRVDGSASTRWAEARIVKMYGADIGVPMTSGTNPSQTPVVLSAAPMVWNEPQLGANIRTLQCDVGAITMMTTVLLDVPLPRVRTRDDQ